MVEELKEVNRVCDLNGRLLAEVKQITSPLVPKLSGNYVDQRMFCIMPSRSAPIFLRLPWLKPRNPFITWDRAAIENRSPLCYGHCLRSAEAGSVPVNEVLSEDICLEKIGRVCRNSRRFF